MKLTVQYFGIAAALCFAYGVHAGPAMQPQNKQVSFHLNGSYLMATF